jgi:hypothetical protein
MSVEIHGGAISGGRVAAPRPARSVTAPDRPVSPSMRRRPWLSSARRCVLDTPSSTSALSAASPASHRRGARGTARSTPRRRLRRRASGRARRPKASESGHRGQPRQRRHTFNIGSASRTPGSRGANPISPQGAGPRPPADGAGAGAWIATRLDQRAAPATRVKWSWKERSPPSPRTSFSVNGIPVVQCRVRRRRRRPGARRQGRGEGQRRRRRGRRHRVSVEDEEGIRRGLRTARAIASIDTKTHTSCCARSR